MLLAGIIDNTTGLNADEFARVHLFGPLGISDYNWRTVSSGVTDVDGGLRMRGRDLAKIGQLILQDGTWDGTQIIPEAWVTESTADWVDTGDGYHYG